MYKLVIIEDDPMIRKNLLQHFEKSLYIECIFNTDSAERFLKYNFGDDKIDVILLDVNLPFKSGIEALPSIRKKNPDAEIIMYTILDENDKIFQAICNGATGYLLKSSTPAEVERHIMLTLEEGGSPISPQVARRIIKYFNPDKAPQQQDYALNETESKIIHYLKDALTYETIASRLNITIHGVRYHIVNIYKKLQVSSKQQAINKFFNK